MQNREYPCTDVVDTHREKAAYFDAQRRKAEGLAGTRRAGAGGPEPSRVSKNHAHCVDIVLAEQAMKRDGGTHGLSCACKSCQAFAQRVTKRRAAPGCL